MYTNLKSFPSEFLQYLLQPTIKQELRIHLLSPSSNSAHSGNGLPSSGLFLLHSRYPFHTNLGNSPGFGLFSGTVLTKLSSSCISPSVKLLPWPPILSRPPILPRPGLCSIRAKHLTVSPALKTSPSSQYSGRSGGANATSFPPRTSTPPYPRLTSAKLTLHPKPPRIVVG